MSVLVCDTSLSVLVYVSVCRSVCVCVSVGYVRVSE